MNSITRLMLLLFCLTVCPVFIQADDSPPAPPALPESSGSSKLAAPDYASLFELLEQGLAGTSGSFQNIEVGQTTLRALYADTDEKTREEILSQIQHVQSFTIRNKASQTVFNVSAMIFKNGTYAPRYISLVEEMAQKNAQAPGSSLVSIHDFVMEDFAGIKADKARKISFKVFEKGREEGLKQVYIRIGRGHIMLEFILINKPISDDNIKYISENIFFKYLQLNKD